MAGREFLFEYRYAGVTWCISMFANDATEAREKIKAVGMARYQGEVHQTISGGSLLGLRLRFVVWLRGLMGGGA